MHEELRWYLIHCKPREDDRARAHLERQGFECYRPMRSVERFRDGLKYTAKEPLFPRYLFIHLDSVKDNWYPIRSTRGVHQIVRFSDYPVAVRDEIIYGIRARLEDRVEGEPYLKPGERVRITAGAFSHVEAIFLTSDGDERVILLLNLMQTEQKLTFPLDCICKAS